MLNRGLDLLKSKKTIKFDTVREQVAQDYALNNDDLVIEMDKLRITPELNIEIPNLGTYRMTDWAKRQIGTILGVKWDKWFNPKYVDHKRIQKEVQHRFSSTGDKRKLRTRRFKTNDTLCDGNLRAVLGHEYCSIDDERIFEQMEKNWGSQIRELMFIKSPNDPARGWGNDHCNYYTVVGEPVDMGPVNMNHEDETVKKWYGVAEREGALPDRDYIYPGFRIRNSEVGYSALTIDNFSMRLVCLNGLIITTGDSRLMYRRHRAIIDSELNKQLGSVFTKVNGVWTKTNAALDSMKNTAVDNVAQAIDTFLKSMGAPKKFRENVIKAHEIEPHQTQYGVLQAITRAAREYPNMDRRNEYESMAGEYLNSVAKNIARPLLS